MNSNAPLFLPLMTLSVLVVVASLAAALVAFANWNARDRYAEKAAQAEEVHPFDGVAVTELMFQAFQTGRRARRLASVAAAGIIMTAFVWAAPALTDGLLAS